LGKFWGYTVSKIGYTISEAAAAVGVQDKTIELAITARELTARRIAAQPIITRTDLEAWLTNGPNWLD